MFAEVAVDRRLPVGAGTAAGEGLVLTYRVPDGLEVRPGQMVIVPLAARVAGGLVVGVSEHSDLARVRELLRLVDTTPVLTPDQIALGRWISNYYASSLYDALALMLPPGVQQHEVVTLHLSAARPGTVGKLTERQRRVLQALQAAEGVLTIDQVRTRLRDPEIGR